MKNFFYFYSNTIKLQELLGNLSEKKLYVVGSCSLTLMLQWQPVFDRHFFRKYFSHCNFKFLAHISVPFLILINFV